MLLLYPILETIFKNDTTLRYIPYDLNPLMRTFSNMIFSLANLQHVQSSIWSNVQMSEAFNPLETNEPYRFKSK